MYLSPSTSLHVKYYGVIGDRPALTLILNFIEHTGYYCCNFCFIQGFIIPGRNKQQYSYRKPLVLRDSNTFKLNSLEANIQKKNVFGHLGISILEIILYVPLPQSILVNYQHAILLRHFRDAVKQISAMLIPAKMRGTEDFLYIKTPELRNLLLYGFLPRFYSVIEINRAAHMALFICGIRIIHSHAIFGK
ncbi:unnamed protein product [Didymodactylos carnosus]|uniref:Uncharacterized protein n=1 Tax=Didymodactylos carnosus TaxID=1234261 RepID=A0A814MFE8_9BILA|nr:unnamed protein product [Didymodactylos carnosus]CAF3843631.1 unnamed protein product [Didymodactylos carnosus]